MPSSVKLALSTLIGILGWHGVFLLILIISFKIFHLGQDSTVCPCTWPVAFSTIMFLVPSLTSYMIAFFAYFRQDSGSVPWRALKTFYEFKRSCDFFNGCTDFDFHAELCLHCRRVKHDWTLVKIAVSAVFSLLYPLVWLIFTFLQANYYECAEVGPSSKILSSYCNVTIGDIPKDYDKNYALAGIRSKVIGGVLFVCMLFVVGLFVILYGEIENYMKKIDVSPPESDTVLAVHVTVMSDRSSGAVESSAVSRRNSVQSVTSAKGSIEAGSQVSLDSCSPILDFGCRPILGTVRFWAAFDFGRHPILYAVRFWVPSDFRRCPILYAVRFWAPFDLRLRPILDAV